jgi:hypothetical protein
MARQQPDGAAEVLRAVWAAEGQGTGDLDAGHHGKRCRNMQHVSFDGLAPPGSDLRSAWRDRLAREGKLDTSGGSVRDLVFGTGRQSDDATGERPARG